MGAPLRNHWCTNEVGLFDHLPFEQLSVLSTTALPPIDGAVCETGDAGTPVPLSATRCGLLAALLEISSVAVLAPLERGRKATPIAHCAPGGTKIDDGEQWSLMRTKSSRLEPVMVARGPIVCGPLLVSVTVCVPLCVPDRWLPKLSEVGLTEAVGGVARNTDALLVLVGLDQVDVPVFVEVAGLDVGQVVTSGRRRAVERVARAAAVAEQDVEGALGQLAPVDEVEVAVVVEVADRDGDALVAGQRGGELVLREGAAGGAGEQDVDPLIGRRVEDRHGDILAPVVVEIARGWLPGLASERDRRLGDERAA